MEQPYFNPIAYIFNFLWILLLVLFVVLPVWRRFLLDKAREAIIEKLERKRGSRVITLIHRQESLALLGVPIFRFINIEDSEQVLRAIRMTPEDMPIDLIIHTPGGLALAATQIA
ncbi:MAG: SDH family Clp fold serine proteinase, partial [Hydrogenobacter sp.]